MCTCKARRKMEDGNIHDGLLVVFTDTALY